MFRASPPIRSLILLAGLLAMGLSFWGAQGIRTASAQNTLSAAAVVNDDVISGLDLNLRTRLSILSIGAQDTPQIRQRLTPQVLRVMIDERLQLQEAERLSIEVTEPEIDQAFAQIAERNRMSPQQFEQLLRSNGVLPGVMRGQIRAELAWRKVVDRRMRNQVAISDEQIAAEEERLRAAEGQKQYRVAELFLSVDQPGEEEQVKQTAERLLQEIQRGAQFQSLASQFSESMTAPVGGDMGFITLDQLDPAVAQAAANLQKGGIAGPIRGIAGYYIIGIIDQRQLQLGEILWDMRAVTLPLPPGAAEEVVERRLSEAQALREEIEGCSNLQSRVAGEVPDAEVNDLGNQRPGDLPPDMARVTRNTGDEVFSEPFRRADSVVLAMICGRDASGLDRERIANRLRQEQLELLSRRYMRDLRRAANVDIRQ